MENKTGKGKELIQRITGDQIRTALKFTMILYEIMFVIIMIWWLGPALIPWSASPLMRILGIFTGVVYLFLCPIAPVCGIVCGGLGYFRLKKLEQDSQKTRENRKWRMISLMELLMGLVMALPCMMLFLGACSGQI